MRVDLQVDKGNRFGWGFDREEPGPLLEDTGLEGALVVVNSKNSEKMQHTCLGQSPAVWSRAGPVLLGAGLCSRKRAGLDTDTSGLKYQSCFARHGTL